MQGECSLRDKGGEGLVFVQVALCRKESHVSKQVTNYGGVSAFNSPAVYANYCPVMPIINLPALSIIINYPAMHVRY